MTMMPVVTFAEWVDSKYRHEGEKFSAALERLAPEIEIGWKSLFYIYKGARTQPDTARRVEEFTKGEVRAGELVLLPTRAELRDANAGDAEDPSAAA